MLEDVLPPGHVGVDEGLLAAKVDLAVARGLLEVPELDQVLSSQSGVVPLVDRKTLFHQYTVASRRCVATQEILKCNTNVRGEALGH